MANAMGGVVWKSKTRSCRESLGEIRRKETLLREKLKKTEEELRRIQKGKEQAEENEKESFREWCSPKGGIKDNSIRIQTYLLSSTQV